VVKGGVGLASGSPDWFCFGLTLMIPHSCLEYGMGLLFERDILVQPIYGWVVRRSP